VLDGQHIIPSRSNNEQTRWVKQTGFQSEHCPLIPTNSTNAYIGRLTNAVKDRLGLRGGQPFLVH
jgi:hypothetical protein